MASKPESAKVAKRHGLREIEVHFGTFDYKLICIVGPWDGVPAYAAWKLEDPEAANMIELSNNGYRPRGKIIRRRGYVPIIWIPRRPRTPREHGTLAHEVFHAVTLLMDWAAISLSDETEEVYCHALGHAVTDILAKLSRA